MAVADKSDILWHLRSVKPQKLITISLIVGAVVIVTRTGILQNTPWSRIPNQIAGSLHRSPADQPNLWISNVKKKTRDDEARDHDPGRLKGDILEILQSDTVRDEKMDRARSRLALLSKAEGSSATIKWLTDTVGDGTDFAVLVSAIFDGADDPIDVLFSNIRSLPKRSQSIASAVLFQKILNSKNPSEEIKAALTAEDQKLSPEGVALALKLCFSQSPSLLNTTEQMRRIAKGLEGEDKRFFQQSYLLGLSEVSPKDGWQELIELNGEGENNKSWQADLRVKVSAQLRASLGAAASLDFLLQNGGRASELEKSVVMWGNMNPVDLKQWVSQNLETFNSSQRDGIRSGLVDLALDKQDFSKGRSEIDQIKDSAIRANLERRLWEEQRNTVRAQMSSNPKETLSSILSGRSQHGDYWIEEAMGTWVAKDFDNAQQWYQENWKQLPAQKAQYVAAAFANQATGQGDATTARQWAAHIQDPKTKQRIEAGIAKIEAAKSN